MLRLNGRPLPLLVASLLVATVSSTLYQDCGSESTILAMTITNCEVPPCIVERPNNYTISITFQAVSSADTLNTTIIATVGGADVPWPAPSACGLLGDMSCPIQAGETYPYALTMQVLPEYPQISALVTVILPDEHDVKHACVMFPVTVV